MAVVTPIKVKGRELKPHKAIVAPLLGAPTVLTIEPWTFVSLWLKREKEHDALFYWDQAFEFHKASMGLPLQSAPLVLYYSFLNAVKTLLVAKSVPFDEHHGVRRHKMGGATNRINIANEGVRILRRGVVPALSTYYGEAERLKTHSLQELFFNMAFIHRSYCLTYKAQTEMFVPLVNCRYVAEKSSNQVYLRADLSKDFASSQTVKRLPPSFKSDASSGQRAIRSTATVHCSKPRGPTPADLNNLAGLHRQLREDLHYINGVETLWYVKAKASGPRRLDRRSPTLVLAAMHRLSEICRYRPLELASYLSGQKNWLLSEFIQMSPVQFIDEIASEITGHQFLVPNVRSAT